MADNIDAILRGMGETADEVADFLRGQGVKGRKLVEVGCPLAVFLSRSTGRIVRVGRYMWSCPGGPDGYLTRGGVGFVENMDAGAYTDLVS